MFSRDDIRRYAIKAPEIPPDEQKFTAPSVWREDSATESNGTLQCT